MDLPPSRAGETRDADAEATPARRRGPVMAGRFELRGVLGRGGMSTVFRARDRATCRDVALKVVRGLAGEAARRAARLQREAALTAAVQHPGIVTVHDAGEDDLAGAWVALELVQEARTLDAAWAGRPLHDKLALLRDAARAVGHAHRCGVVHRDLKPGNVLVDGAGRVRVVDFGLATAVWVPRLTQTGALVGTPLYMAPEQLRGAREEVGPAADVWALGVCLHELLTGRTPFEASDLQGVMRRITRGLRAPLEGDLAPDLRDLVDRALALDPRARPADGEAFAAELDRHLHPPAAPAPAAAPARRRSWGGQRLASLALAALVAATAAPLLGRAVGAAPHPPAPTPVAVAR